LESLAKRHIETKFCKINAENCPFLAEKLNIVLMPTIIMTQDNFCADRIEGFDELGGRDDFTTEQLEQRLVKKAPIIDFDEMAAMQKSVAAKKAAAAGGNKGVKTNRDKKAIYASASNRRRDDSDSDDAEEDEDD
jgi:hypothetical protein